VPLTTLLTVRRNGPGVLGFILASLGIAVLALA
jgi:hypothetical protein